MARKKRDKNNYQQLSVSEKNLIKKYCANALEKNINKETLHQIFNVSMSSLYNWEKIIKEKGKEYFLNSLRHNEFNENDEYEYFPKDQKVQKNTVLFTKHMEKKIRNIIESDKTPYDYDIDLATWTTKSVYLFLEKEYPNAKLPSRRTIDYHLKKMGLVVRRPVYLAIQRDEEYIKEWKTKKIRKYLQLALIAGFKVFQLDETAVKQDKNGTYGYTIKNRPAIAKENRSSHYKQRNLLVAMSHEGDFVAQSQKCSFCEDDLINFLKELIRLYGKVCVFMDNVKFHKSRRVNNFIRRNKDKLMVFYFPEYAPELNPVEIFNQELKNFLKLLGPLTPKRLIEKFNLFIEEELSDKTFTMNHYKAENAKYFMDALEEVKKSLIAS